MRILLACEFYHPSVGGVQEVMRQVAEQLVDRGHSVTVATSYLPERVVRALNGVTIVEFKAAGNRVRGLSGAIEAYQQYVLASDYDVIMVKAAQQWTFDALWPVLHQMRRPIVFIPCGFSGLYESAYRQYFEEMPAVLRQLDHLIFYASDYRDINFTRDLGLSRWTVVSNGASKREFGVPVDPDFRRRHGISEDAFLVLTVGTFTGDMKGHREVAEAFESTTFEGRPAALILNGNTIPSPRARRVVARTYIRVIRHWGRTLVRMLSGKTLHPDRGTLPIASIVARINRSPSAKQATVVDLPRAELVQAFLNSDVFVFASHIEYSPLVLFEAAAAGLPFLTVPVGNAVEIAAWTGGGVVCPAPIDERGYTRVDPAVLADHLSRLAADPVLLASLSREGRRNWSERFTWEAVTDSYEALLVHLVEPNRRRDVED